MKKYIFDLLEKNRRKIALLLLLPILYLDYLIITNFAIIQDWLMEATGAHQLPKGNGDVWIGLLLLFGLSVFVGLILSKSRTAK